MSKTLLAALLAAAALSLLPSPAAAQNESPFEGAWKGRIISTGSDQELLLYIFDAPDKTTGMIVLLDEDKTEYELLNVVRRDDMLSFEYGDPYETGLKPRIKVELKPAAGGLVGTWSDSEGRSGTLRLSRDEAATPAKRPVLPPAPEDAVVGTWTGEMVSSEINAAIELLVDRDADGLFGVLCPDVKSLTEFDLESLAFKDGTLSCDYQDTRGSQPVRVTLELKLTDETTLAGTFRDPSGKSGTIKLTLKNEAPAGLL